MYKWITCYLTGNHEFQVACEPGAIFLRCHHCGRRSNGWELHQEHGMQPAPIRVPEAPRRQPALRAAR